jgi:hypothetical protein
LAEETCVIVGAPPPFQGGETVELAAMERKKPGRPSKGERRIVRALLPVRLAEALYDEAARRGMTVTDLLGELASSATGVPYINQEALSLSA